MLKYIKKIIEKLINMKNKAESVVEYNMTNRFGRFIVIALLVGFATPFIQDFLSFIMIKIG